MCIYIPTYTFQSDRKFRKKVCPYDNILGILIVINYFFLTSDTGPNLTV